MVETVMNTYHIFDISIHIAAGILFMRVYQLLLDCKL